MLLQKKSSLRIGEKLLENEKRSKSSGKNNVFPTNVTE